MGHAPLEARARHDSRGEPAEACCAAEGLGCFRESCHLEDMTIAARLLVAPLSGRLSRPDPGYIKRADVAWYASTTTRPRGLTSLRI